MPNWNRLIRFIADDGEIYRGEPIISESNYDIGQQFIEGKSIKAKVVEGDIFTDARVTDKILEVRELLGPLTCEDVPIIKCVGMNYKFKDISPPPNPQIFYKPRTSIADNNEAIPIPKIAQNNQCDYEGELCVVIGKTGKDIEEIDAFNYIAGYVVGDDISSRLWQAHPDYAGNNPQVCFSKSFDRYAPLGPVLVSSKIIGNPELQLQTKINGDIRQNANTNELIFNIPKIIAFLSQGTTLEKGTVIMTGTPAGVGAVDQKYLKDGDLIEIFIEQIGTLFHKVSFI